MSIMSITRRSFLRGCCIITGGIAFGVHWTGRAMAAALSVKDHMKARIASVYREDKRYPSRTSMDNEQVKLLYKKFLGQPLSEKPHHLLHNHWIDKSAALKSLSDAGQYPGPRGGEFRFKNYPHEG